MAGIARVSLSRNNNTTKPRLSRSQPSLTTAGAPRGVSTFFLDNVGPLDAYSPALPFVFHDDYGVSPFALTMKQGKKKKKKQSMDAAAAADSSDDDECEETAAEVKGKQQQQQQQASSVKRDDAEALYFKMDMPGVGKEDAKLYLEGFTLIAKGVRKSDPMFDDVTSSANKNKTYTGGVNLMPMIKYKIDGIKAEMKNGVLKVKVPKLKDEERTDVINFQID